MSLLPTVLGSLCFVLLSTAPPLDPAPIDTIVRDAREFWGAPGVAIGIVLRDEVVYLKGFGVKQWGKDDPVTPDTLFPLASCTKAFTTTALAMLADEGKLTWDDPVRKHVDFFHLADPLADADVTLRDLVTHRTGLGSNDLLWYRSPWSRDEIIRRIGRVPLKYPFRSTFHYQSTMFAAAGCAVETAAHGKWDDFIRQRIFTPLGMTKSTVTTTAAEKNPDHASPHRRNARGELEVMDWYPMPNPDPAGSINASVRDLCQWTRLHLGEGMYQGKQLVSTKNLGETHLPQMVIRFEGPTKDMNPETIHMSYGMGWVIQDYHGHKMMSHAGAIDGFRAHIALVPDAQLGIVLLNNLHNTHMNLAVGNAIVDLVMNLPKRDWNAYVAQQLKKEAAGVMARLRARDDLRQRGTKPSHGLADYTGDYLNPAYGTATVSLNNGTLTWKWNTFKDSLEHFHYDTFTLENEFLGRPQIQFTLDRDGSIAALKVLDIMEAEFKKQKP